MGEAKRGAAHDDTTAVNEPKPPDRASQPLLQRYASVLAGGVASGRRDVPNAMRVGLILPLWPPSDSGKTENSQN